MYTYFKHIYTYFYIYLPIFTWIIVSKVLISTYIYLYLPHISTYFHVYFYLFSCIFLLISTYLLLFLHISTYIYLYLPHKCGILLQFATKVCCFTTDCHKSVLHLLQFTGIYLYLPHKCGILLQFATKVWHIRDPYCPIRELEMYPKMGYKLTMYPKYPTWGTDGVQKLALRKIHTFVAYLKKLKTNLTTPIFLVGLIYRWGKGPKFKNICINVSFSRTICEKKEKKKITF